MKKRMATLVIVGLLSVFVCGCSTDKPKHAAPQEPKEEIVPEKKVDDKPVVLINTTQGEIKIELDRERAPLTVENFLAYVEEGHYDNTIFHRVIDGFMIQGGGLTKEMVQKPTRKGIKNEANNGLKNTLGTVAMARTVDINSARAQFFINVDDNDFLDYKSDEPKEYGYCVFGKVIEGMDVVRAIQAAPVGNQNNYQNVPIEFVEIKSITKLVD